MQMQYYKLTDDVIRKKVPDKMGVYFLGDLKNGVFTVRYVGRSDDSLRCRLLNHNYKGIFPLFSYKTTTTKKDAFMLETESYYLYKEKLVNKIHPDLPRALMFEHPADTLGRVLKRKMLKGEKHERRKTRR